MAMGKGPTESRPRSRLSFVSTNEELRDAVGRARFRSRVENFTTQLKLRGFATVQLCPEEDLHPDGTQVEAGGQEGEGQRKGKGCR